MLRVVGTRELSLRLHEVSKSPPESVEAWEEFLNNLTYQHPTLSEEKKAWDLFLITYMDDDFDPYLYPEDLEEAPKEYKEKCYYLDNNGEVSEALFDDFNDKRRYKLKYKTWAERVMAHCRRTVRILYGEANALPSNPGTDPTVSSS